MLVSKDRRDVGYEGTYLAGTTPYCVKVDDDRVPRLLRGAQGRVPVAGGRNLDRLVLDPIRIHRAPGYTIG
jgi:hypothetical protein